jgi:peptidoglycan/LPS O-acetylase OafA/YrhL
VLNIKPVIYVGTLSYSIYLWQQPFVRYQGTGLTTFPFNLGVIGILAAISYYCVEQPFLRVRKWIERPKQRTHDLELVSSADSAE